MNHQISNRVVKIECEVEVVNQISPESGRYDETDGIFGDGCKTNGQSNIDGIEEEINLTVALGGSNFECTQKDSSPTSFINMPFDIIVQIFEELNFFTPELLYEPAIYPILLGMTCTKFYSYFKIWNPRPVSLGQVDFCLCGTEPRYNCENIDFPCNPPLGFFLQDFFGPRYRFWSEPMELSRFLLKEVYGNEKNDLMESQLASRYRDYYTNSQLCSVKGNFPFNFNPIPNPFNMGNEWDAAAIEALEHTIWDFTSVQDWKRVFYYCEVFRDNRARFDRIVDDFMWERFFSEGISLMGFHGEESRDFDREVHQGFTITNT